MLERERNLRRACAQAAVQEGTASTRSLFSGDTANDILMLASRVSLCVCSMRLFCTRLVSSLLLACACLPASQHTANNAALLVRLYSICAAQLI